MKQQNLPGSSQTRDMVMRPEDSHKLLNKFKDAQTIGDQVFQLEVRSRLSPLTISYSWL